MDSIGGAMKRNITSESTIAAARVLPEVLHNTRLLLETRFSSRPLPVMRSRMTMMTNEKTARAADEDGFTSVYVLLYISASMVKYLGFPPRLMTIRKEGKQKRNISVNAASSVLHVLGRVILMNVVNSEAPRSLEVFSSVSGMELSDDVISENATGKFR